MMGSRDTRNRRKSADEARVCQHCGALVYGDSRACPQCGKFPVRLHCCPKCGFISPGDAARCERCGRVFEPNGDYI